MKDREELKDHKVSHDAKSSLCSLQVKFFCFHNILMEQRGAIQERVSLDLLFS